MMTVKNYCPVLTGARRAPGATSPTFCWLTALALALICALAAPALALPTDPSLFRPGLRNSPGADKLSAEQLDLLVKSLREKTGFLELRFDEDGFLSLGDRTRIVGGSATARALLVATVDGVKAILLKNRLRSSEVAFARVAVATTYTNARTGMRIDTYSLELDFADFARLQGEREVIAAFDPGLVMLHELGHAVLALQDDKANARGLGDCEEYVNQIRRELGLPERQHYLARQRKTTQGGGTAEIYFVQREHGKTRQLYLRWEAEQVGLIVESARPAASHKGDASLIAKR
jgi:hypothetical protein